jgi:small subunit ribosomal protein S9
MKVIHESGSRKQAVARATLMPGTGVVRVNKLLLSAIPKNMFREKIEESLFLAGDAANKVNLTVSVEGGGPNSQAEAVRIAISNCFVQFDKKLKTKYLDYDRAFLVPDVRRKETRKPNTHGKARSKRQKSYR